MSNIILYCFAARRFRHELERMIKVWINTIRKHLPCYSTCLCKTSKEITNQSEDERFSAPSKTSSRRFNTFKRRNKTKYDYIELRIVTSRDTLF